MHGWVHITKITLGSHKVSQKGTLTRLPCLFWRRLNAHQNIPPPTSKSDQILPVLTPTKSLNQQSIQYLPPQYDPGPRCCRLSWFMVATETSIDWYCTIPCTPGAWLPPRLYLSPTHGPINLMRFCDLRLAKAWFTLRILKFKNMGLFTPKNRRYLLIDFL